MPITRTDRGLVTVFGGTGFVGRHVVRALLKRGWRVRAAVRRPNLAGHLQPLGMVGWVQPVQANLRYRKSVDNAVIGADAVVNVVGVRHESSRQRYEAVQDFGSRAVAEAARGAGLDRIVHLSAIGADPEGSSRYARTKAAGEAAVIETLPASTILRPSVLFGPEDRFFNQLAAIARISPVMPLFGGGHTRFQPVFVGDLAQAIADAVEGEAAAGKTYEIGGPEILSWKELNELVLEEIERWRLLMPLPWMLSDVSARVFGLLPKPLVTPDQMRQLRVDNLVSEAAIAEGRTLDAFGIRPTALAAILPEYLWRFRRTGQYDRLQSGDAT